MPIFPVFDVPYPLIVQFHILNFNPHFDGIIGINILKALKSKLNFILHQLETPDCCFNLNYQTQVPPTIKTITIPPRSKSVNYIPVTTENGETLLPYTEINNCEIPECWVTANNYFAITTVLNPTSEPITINFNKALKTQKLRETDVINCYTNYEQICQNKYNLKKTKIDLSKFRTSHLNEEEKSSLIKVITDYKDIFYNENQDLTFTNQIKHTIKTKDEQPIYTKSYRYPFVHKEEVKNQIQKMLNQKIIQPSVSPWSSPIWIVPKKLDASGTQKWRIVIDYRKLNEKTINDKYPLPNISDILDKLGKAQYFTTLDLASGFHQIEIEAEDREKTAFNTENGHYEFLRMPFGLKNAPATFQRVMDNVLRGLHDETCLVYLDDIVIYSTSLQEHIDKLKKVFDRLRQTNFKVQLDKSEFLKRETNYLGHVITEKGIKPNPDKVSAIKKFPIPKTTKEIKSFLGLLGYYRKFIKDFAKITKPMTNCLKKGNKIVHNEEFVECFEICKNLLINDPILNYPDFNKPFILTTDASDVAIGAVLSQGNVPNDLPVAYASRTLNKSESKYSTTEKELLAIVWATKYFRPYLYGRKFFIYTDHKPLQWLMSLKEPGSKLVRWRLKLEEFDYEVIYKKGSLNVVADSLSRVQIYTNETTDVDSMIANMDNDEIREILRDIESELDNIIPDDPQPLPLPENSQTQHTNINENLIVDVPISDIPINYFNNQIIISKSLMPINSPKIEKPFKGKLRLRIGFTENNLKEELINFVKQYIAPNVKYGIYFKDDSLYVPFCNITREIFKYPSFKFVKCINILADIINVKDQNELIKNHHDNKNHRGIVETRLNIRRFYYWPNLDKSVSDYINNCEICKQTKYQRNPLKIEFNITPTPTKPFKILHMDTFQVANTKFLTIIDKFSKLAQAYPLNSLNALDIADSLLNYFNHYGIPELIITDQGSEFKNTVISDLFKLHKIKIQFGSSGHPESNSPIERFHSTIIEHIRILKTTQNQLNIKQLMQYALLAYNNSIHSVTKYTPMEIIIGNFENKSSLDLDIESRLYSDYIQNRKETLKIIYDKIYNDSLNYKTKIIEKLNKNREQFNPEENKKVFIKGKQRQPKISNPYSPQIIQNFDPTHKTITIDKNIKKHVSDVRRPPKIQSLLQDVPTDDTDIDDRPGPSNKI